MNTLEVILGEEYKIKVEKLEEFKDSLFRDLYIQAFKKTKEILEASFNDDKRDHYNNIIAFVGERGTGKTSSMLSVSGVLQNRFQFNNSKTSNEIELEKFNLEVKGGMLLNAYNFHSVGIIDPSMLSHNSNILEIVIAKMFQNFKNHLDEKSKSHIDEDKKRKLITLFQEVFNNLKIINNRKDIFQEDPLDALLAISATTDFKIHVSKLIDTYMDFMLSESRNKNHMFLLEIDDIDLNTKHAYKMIEQLRKYFILPNVVIFMAVKIEQLSEIIEKELAEEFKLMLENEQMNFDSIKNMSEKYLEKLIPLERRLSLPYLLDISGECKLIINDKNNKNVTKGDKNYQSIDSELRELIYRKTDMIFLDGKYILPSNLRGLIELVVFLHNMEDVKTPETFERVVKRDIIVQSEGYKNFKKYFLNTWTSSNLSKNYTNILIELYNKPIEAKNKYIVNKIEDLYSFISKDEKYYQRADDKKYNDLEKEYQEIVHLNNKDFNISLGDVLFVLDKANKYKIDEVDKRLLYGIKTVYSFMLYEAYALKNKDNYKTLLGGYVYNPSTYPLMKKDINGNYRSRRAINITSLSALSDELLRAQVKIDETNKEFINVYSVFDNFIVKDVSFNSIKKYRQELEKFYEKRSLNSIISNRNIKTIEFDSLGFLFNNPDDEFYIGNIEILEKILDYKYSYTGGDYVSNLESFFTEISNKTIPVNFSKYCIKIGNSRQLENMIKLIQVMKKLNLTSYFNDIFLETLAKEDVEEVLTAMKFKNNGSVELITIKNEIEKNLKSKIFQSQLTIVKRLGKRIEEWKNTLESFEDVKTKDGKGKIKYNRKKVYDNFKKLVDSFFDEYYGE